MQTEIASTIEPNPKVKVFFEGYRHHHFNWDGASRIVMRIMRAAQANPKLPMHVNIESLGTLRGQEDEYDQTLESGALAFSNTSSNVRELFRYRDDPASLLNLGLTTPEMLRTLIMHLNYAGLRQNLPNIRFIPEAHDQQVIDEARNFLAQADKLWSPMDQAYDRGQFETFVQLGRKANDLVIKSYDTREPDIIEAGKSSIEEMLAGTGGQIFFVYGPAHIQLVKELEKVYQDNNKLGFYYNVVPDHRRFPTLQTRIREKAQLDDTDFARDYLLVKITSSMFKNIHQLPNFNVLAATFERMLTALTEEVHKLPPGKIRKIVGAISPEVYLSAAIRRHQTWLKTGRV